MNITYECGSCNTRYLIDESIITKAGIKVTCAQCHTYFFLRSGEHATVQPIIEKIAEQDGPYQENVPPPLPGEKTTERILNDVIDSLSPELDSDDSPEIVKSPKPDFEDKSSEKAPEPIEEIEFKNTPAMSKEIQAQFLDEVKPVSPPRNTLSFEATGNFYDPDTIITKDSLADYPSEPPESKADRSMVWFALLSSLITAMLLLNYKSIIKLPGLDFIREENMQKLEKSIPKKSSTTEKSTTERPQYGFPNLDDIPKNKK